MYILELLFKLLNKNKSDNKNIEPIFNPEAEEYEEENCEHIFIPIDSTKEVLACSKCGFVIKKSDIPSNNFFLK